MRLCGSLLKAVVWRGRPYRPPQAPGKLEQHRPMVSRRHRQKIAQPLRQSTITVSRRIDQGSVTLELVILAPALIVMLLVVIAAGRIAQAHQAVEAAAHDAARQASIARDPTTARANATASAQDALSREGLTCRPHVSVDVSGFARPLGTPAAVTAHITCTVELADVAIAGVSAVTVSARATSPIDPFRGRALERLRASSTPTGPIGFTTKSA